MKIVPEPVSTPTNAANVTDPTRKLRFSLSLVLTVTSSPFHVQRVNLTRTRPNAGNSFTTPRSETSRTWILHSSLTPHGRVEQRPQHQRVLHVLGLVDHFVEPA